MKFVSDGSVNKAGFAANFFKGQRVYVVNSNLISPESNCVCSYPYNIAAVKVKFLFSGHCIEGFIL